MIKKVHEYIEQQHLLKKGDRIVMGISGGADSMAMLLVLSALKQQYALSLFAVHINHGIRQEAETDADFVKKICKTYEIPFYLYKADIPAMAEKFKKSEEEMGRDYRYQCLFQVAEQVEADVAAVAHHMGDQAETVLFHLARGADLAGASGIRPETEMMMEGGTLRIIRPLLSCEKQEIKAWLKQKGMNWREDITNRDNTYMRNQLRNEVIPRLEHVNSKAVSHIAEFAGQMAEYEDFFKNAVAEYIEKNVNFDEDSPDCCKTERYLLFSREPVLARAVIYEMMIRICGRKKDLQREHMNEVYSLLGSQSGKRIILPYGMEAVVSYENLIIRKCFKEEAKTRWKQEIKLACLLLPEKGITREVLLPFGGRLFLEVLEVSKMTEEERKKILIDARNPKNNYTKFFDCVTIKDTLYIRTVEKNDYLVINEAGSRKKISRYFIDTKIPQDLREQTVVLAVNQEVLWIIGGRRCEGFKITDDTQFILKVTYKGE